MRTNVDLTSNRKKVKRMLAITDNSDRSSLK